MTTLVAIGGLIILLALLVPAVAFMNKTVERSPLAGLIIILAGVTIAIVTVAEYAKAVR